MDKSETYIKMCEKAEEIQGTMKMQDTTSHSYYYCPTHKAASELLDACKKMANFLYGYSESEKRVPSKDYPKFKEIYTQGFNAIDKAEGR